ncbi:MAG: hypothetical protein ACQGVC_17090 [Myxococcota bacterium]
MQNVKTTVLGYATLIGAAIDFLSALMGSGDVNLTWTQLGAAAAGVGLINASDGGH